MRSWLLDTGPLVAYLNERDASHASVAACLGRFTGGVLDNLYAGRDGNVYRREGGGWQKYDGGDWTPVERRPGERSLEGARDRAQGAGDRAGSIERGRTGTGSGRTLDGLDRDFNNRAEGVRRSRDYGSWQESGSRGSFGGRSSVGGSFGGRGRVGGRGGGLRRGGR